MQLIQDHLKRNRLSTMSREMMMTSVPRLSDANQRMRSFRLFTVVAFALSTAACDPEPKPVPTSLNISTQPGGATSSAPLSPQPVVRILDQNGDVYSNGIQQVSVAIASGPGTLGGTTQVAAVSGVVQFTNLTITGGGSYTLQFSANSLAPAASQPVTITQIPAAVTVGTQPAGAVSGLPFGQQPVVTIRDASNSVVLGSTATVTASVTSGTGALVGSATVNAVAGVATFSSLRIDGRGNHVVTFSALGLPAVASSTFTVTQTPASLAVSTQPSTTAQSGTLFATQPVITIRDHAGIPVFGNTANVIATAASGGGVLGGTATVAAVNGVATFADLRISGSGPHTLSFASAGLAAVNSSTVTVAAGPPTQMAIVTQPAQAVSGITLATQPVLQLRDATNQLANGSTATVTAAITSGSGSISGTTSVAAVGGVATFTNLRIDGAGQHVITFSSPNLPNLASAAFVVSQVAAGLQMLTQPSGASDGFVLTTPPAVRVVDQAGLPIVSGAAAALSVTASKASGSGTLYGTTTVNAVGGTATFANLTIGGSGAHSLGFTAPGVTGVTSAAFSVAGPTGIQVRVGTVATSALSAGEQITIPISIDLTARGSANLASISLSITWDPARWNYVSNAAGIWTDAAGNASSVFVNVDNTATGTISIAGFTTSGTLASFTLRTITLQANATGASVTTSVSAAVSAAGNEAGSPVTVTPRNLTVTVSP